SPTSSSAIRTGSSAVAIARGSDQGRRARVSRGAGRPSARRWWLRTLLLREEKSPPRSTRGGASLECTILLSRPVSGGSALIMSSEVTMNKQFDIELVDIVNFC